MAYKSQCADEDDSKTNDMDIPPTHIMQISGHRNVQSINNYGHVSQQQQKNMSLILSSTSTAAEAAAKAPRTSVMTESESKAKTLSLMKSPTVPATGLFSSAVIHGGHFNVTINTVNQSPTSVSTARNSFKRIKQVLDSSDHDDSQLWKQNRHLFWWFRYVLSVFIWLFNNTKAKLICMMHFDVIQILVFNRVSQKRHTKCLTFWIKI